MSAAESLNEYLREVWAEGPDNQDDEHPYRIGDKGHELAEADWAMRKAAYYTDKLHKAQRAAADQKQLIDFWLAEETRRLQPQIEFFTNLLVAWHQEVLEQAFEEAGGDWSKVRGKTRRLPSGNVSARLSPMTVEVDDDVFLPAAPDELVRVKREPDKVAIREHVKATGEIPPGVTVREGDVKFAVTFGSDAREGK